MNLPDHKIPAAPPTAYYVPNFLSEPDEQHLLRKIYAVPKPKWTRLKNRRLQDHGGVPHAGGMVPDRIAPFLAPLMDRVSDLGIYRGGAARANHVLVNEYLPGQGIMAHLDGDVFAPTIATVTLGSHAVLEFSEDAVARVPVCSLLLERRSLVVLMEDMFGRYLHSIEEIEEDVIKDNCVNLGLCGDVVKVGDRLRRETRVSLTIRNVPKVAKADLMGILMGRKT